MATRKKSVETPKEAVPTWEQEQVSRGLLDWLNQYPDFPYGVKGMAFEFLEEDRPCMMLSTIQGTYIIKRYHGGDYMAEYQFALFYRGQPTTDSDRLKLNETLDAIGDWAKWRMNVLQEAPNIGAKKRVQKIIVNARADLVGRNENGDEDSQILMTMTYYSERG